MKVEKEADANEKTRKVTFLEEKPDAPVGGSGGRQLVPGLLLVGDQSASLQPSKTKPAEAAAATNGSDAKKSGPLTKAAPQPPVEGVRSKDKLLYLARLMNIQVQFSDFPKANHVMYLTLVSLSTTPPQVMPFSTVETM